MVVVDRVNNIRQSKDCVESKRFISNLLENCSNVKFEGLFCSFIRLVDRLHVQMPLCV